jgi:site-specific DNA recombinase
MANPPRPDLADASSRHLHRISWDPDGQRAGVERQRVDCEALCTRPTLGDRRILRGQRPLGPQRQAPAGLRADTDWDRQPASTPSLPGTTTGCTVAAGTGSFIDLVERSGVRIAVVSGGDYHLTTPGGGDLRPASSGAVARKESEDRSRRVRRKDLELAEKGRPASHLGWGVRDEAERELVRQAAGRVLAGQGLVTIARD